MVLAALDGRGWCHGRPDGPTRTHTEETDMTTIEARRAERDRDQRARARDDDPDALAFGDVDADDPTGAILALLHGDPWAVRA